MIYVWPESKEQNQKYLKGTSDLSVLFVQTNLKLERHGTRVAKEREESKLCKAELRNSHLCRWHPPACPASTDRHSLCHCNWHGNHNDDRSPWGGGAWTWEISFTNTRWASGKKGEPTGWLRAGTDKAVFALQMIEIVNAQSLSWYGTRRDMNADKVARRQHRRRYDGANTSALLNLCSPLRGRLFFSVLQQI